MATRAQFHGLFHLPPALRCRIVMPLERPYQDIHIFQRAFSRTTRRPARQPKSHPPPPPRSPGSAKSTQPPTRPGAKPPTPTAPPPRPGSSLESELIRLLETSNRILLYKSPSHKSFFFSSYLFGTIIIGSSVLHASFTQDEQQLPWYIRTTTSGLAIFLAVVGTAFILAPSKIIRSVSLACNPVTNARFLSFRTKPAFPFVGNFRVANTINAPLHEVRIDRAINGDALPPYINVPLPDAQKFTQAEARAAEEAAKQGGVLRHLRNFNRSLVEILSNFWWDTRRMFLRDGFVYVEIPGHGHWKLDLRNAELLDNGRPLTATMASAALDRSVVGWIRAITG